MNADEKAMRYAWLPCPKSGDDLRDQLAEAGQHLKAADSDRAIAMAIIKAIVNEPGSERLTVTEIARLTGVTRQTIYDLRRD